MISRNISEWKEKTLELIFLIEMVVLPSIATLKKPVKCPISLCQRLCDTYLFSRWVKDSMRPISATTAWISRRWKKLNWKFWWTFCTKIQSNVSNHAIQSSMKSHFKKWIKMPFLWVEMENLRYHMLWILELSILSVDF